MLDIRYRGLFKERRAEIECRTSLADAQVQRVQMAVTVADESTVIRVCAEEIAGLVEIG